MAVRAAQPRSPTRSRTTPRPSTRCTGARARPSPPRRSPSAWASPRRRRRPWSSGWSRWAWCSREPYHGVRADRGRGARGAGGHPPPPPARALPGRGAGHALGPRPRGGRGARARDLARAVGADRARSSATPRTTRTATRSRPPTGEIEEGALAPLADLERGRARASSRACRTPTPRCCATCRRAGSRRGDALEVLERQPFDGPLTVRFGVAATRPGRRRWSRMMRVASHADPRRR